jgi:putative aldouronate transport system permease protein
MFSNVIAFMDYEWYNGWMGFGSDWVGFGNFKLFITEPWFWELAFRTFWYAFWGLIIAFPPSIVLALLLNELRMQMFKKVVQTISYIPHFVSWVTVAGLVYVFMSIDPSGIVNNIKQWIFGGERVVFMQNVELFLPMLLITKVWKQVGWGSIIYLASLSTIDPQLYEAAWIDGAGRWKQLLHITLPHIFPTTAVLLIFAMGRLFHADFDQVFNMQNPVIRSRTYVIDVWSFYKGIVDQQYALAGAVSLFQGFITATLLLSTNWLSKRVAKIGII